jgi:hypothetical protein
VRAKTVLSLLLTLSALVGARANAALPALWDTAWILPLTDVATLDAYLETRANQGFDVVMTGITKWGMNVRAGHRVPAAPSPAQIIPATGAGRPLKPPWPTAIYPVGFSVSPL